MFSVPNISAHDFWRSVQSNECSYFIVGPSRIKDYIYIFSFYKALTTERGNKNIKWGNQAVIATWNTRPHSWSYNAILKTTGLDVHIIHIKAHIYPGTLTIHHPSFGLLSSLFSSPSPVQCAGATDGHAHHERCNAPPARKHVMFARDYMKREHVFLLRHPSNRGLKENVDSDLYNTHSLLCVAQLQHIGFSASCFDPAFPWT